MELALPAYGLQPSSPRTRRGDVRCLSPVCDVCYDHPRKRVP